MKRARFTCDAAAIIREVAAQHNMGLADVGLVRGLDMIRAGLARIAARAIELDDAPLLDILEQLGAVKAKGGG